MKCPILTDLRKCYRHTSRGYCFSAHRVYIYDTKRHLITCVTHCCWRRWWVMDAALCLETRRWHIVVHHVKTRTVRTQEEGQTMLVRLVWLWL